jgi:uncharacterized membrane protein YfcA
VSVDALAQAAAGPAAWLPNASPGLLALAVAVVFGAGIVRGFAGFGFSALCVAGLSLVMPPAQVVPPVFVLEVLASSSLLRGALAHADWRWLNWLLAGNALFIPVGVGCWPGVVYPGRSTPRLTRRSGSGSG